MDVAREKCLAKGHTSKAQWRRHRRYFPVFDTHYSDYTFIYPSSIIQKVYQLLGDLSWNKFHYKSTNYTHTLGSNSPPLDYISCAIPTVLTGCATVHPFEEPKVISTFIMPISIGNTLPFQKNPARELSATQNVIGQFSLLPHPHCHCQSLSKPHHLHSMGEIYKTLHIIL